MLIQNTGNMTQIPQTARPAGDGAPNVVVPQAQPSVSLDLPQAAVKPAAEQHASAEQVKTAVDNINRALKQTNKNLEFSVDQSTNKQMFKLKDVETGDVIRQYPTEEMLAISRSIDQFQQGLLLKQKA